MPRRITSRARRVSLLAVTLGLIVVASHRPAEAVVGGQATPQGRYPYVVSVQRDGSHSCGGTVVAQFWVLTAAHCAPDGNAAPLSVVVGSADYATGRRIAVTVVRVHPAYNPDIFSNDAALLWLAGPANLPPIRLATSADEHLEANGAPAVVVGWGSEIPIIGAVPSLGTWQREASIAVVDDAGCGPDDPATMVCAGAFLKDSCQGDSGGPLLATDPTGQRVQIGIVSHGFRCAVPGFPGRYSEVNSNSIRSWIAATVG